MMLTGVLLAVAALLVFALRHHRRARSRLAMAIAMAALVAASGCTGNDSTSAASSDLSSAAGDAMSAADTAGSGLQSAESAMASDSAMATDSSPAAASSAAAGGSESASSASGTYPPDQAQLCQARDQLRTSIGQLTDPSLLTQGASAIGAAVDRTQNDLDAVVTAAQPELKPQLDAVQASLEQLRTAVGNVGSGDVTENLRNVASAAAKVGSSSTELLSELNKICGE